MVVSLRSMVQGQLVAEAVVVELLRQVETATTQLELAATAATGHLRLLRGFLY
jgi:hypothetical protein